MNAVASIADLSGAIHALAGRSAALDDVTRFAAQDLLYAVVLVFGILWCRRDGLRAGLFSVDDLKVMPLTFKARCWKSRSLTTQSGSAATA